MENQINLETLHSLQNWMSLPSLDLSQVINPRGVGGVGGWGRSLTPHTPHTPHIPLPLKPTLCVRNPGWVSLLSQEVISLR
ncbi:MAG: hypothetical protein V7K71_28500 [Nostoc sp.]|uniref:hypothetical protein n=1 Tax=Nostoc sp. TaxID=1180 RepID=UPI002FF44B13